MVGNPWPPCEGSGHRDGHIQVHLGLRADQESVHAQTRILCSRTRSTQFSCLFPVEAHLEEAHLGPRKGCDTGGASTDFVSQGCGEPMAWFKSAIPWSAETSRIGSCSFCTGQGEGRLSCPEPSRAAESHQGPVRGNPDKPICPILGGTFCCRTPELQSRTDKRERRPV